MLKVLVLFDVLRRVNQLESRMVAATAWRELFTENACNFMLLCMRPIMSDEVNPGTFYDVPRLVFFCCSSHSQCS
jgi:hypothetical protein